MASAAELVRQLQKIDIDENVDSSIQETKDVLLDMNKQQLDEGIRADGDKIHWLKDTHYPYTKPYAKKKSAKGLQTSVVDLNFGVGIAKSEQIKVNGTELELSSSIKLGDYLEENYGKQIFGITKENKKAYTFGAFFQAFRKRIESASGLKFS